MNYINSEFITIEKIDEILTSNDKLSFSEEAKAKINHCYEKNGKRCVVKIQDNKVFRKYTDIFAINSKVVVYHEIYEK